ncbi:MAG: protein-L-isoaspartate O-methyltransferase [Caulobacteraceae bacterium]
MTFDFAAARNNMVESQVRTSDVTDHAIQDAMRKVPREALCPPDRQALAYADVEVPYAPGRWLMRPRELAKLLQALRPRAGERALAIAAPYAAAVLEAMGLTVTQLSDGDLSKPVGGDYDVILCEGAVSAVPPAWLAALGPGGRLAVVERAGAVGKARLYVKEADGLASREVFDATPPYLPGFEPKAAFAF